jgi:HTH-type transcriptional regulator / antitoxin HipB
MPNSTKEIGQLIRSVRKSSDITQKELAMTSGTGIRFIVDLENGKETCQFGKVLRVLQTLGIKVTFIVNENNG